MTEPITNPGQGESQVTGQQQQGAAIAEPTLKELNDQFLKMKADHEKALQELETSKKEIAGLNRKNTEYEKTIQTKELEKLSEKERAEAELEIKRKEKEQLDSEIKNLARSRIVDKTLFDSGMPSDFSDRIKGDNEDEIKADVKKLNEYIDKLVVERVTKQVNEKLGGAAPIGGTVTAPTGIQEQYNKAKAERKHAEMIALVRQAQKDGINLIQ